MIGQTPACRVVWSPSTTAGERIFSLNVLRLCGCNNGGWDDKALHDAVSVCALFNFMNRYVEGLGITAGPDYFKQAAVHLHDHGYGGDRSGGTGGTTGWHASRDPR